MLKSVVAKILSEIKVKYVLLQLNLLFHVQEEGCILSQKFHSFALNELFSKLCK